MIRILVCAGGGDKGCGIVVVIVVAAGKEGREGEVIIVFFNCLSGFLMCAISILLCSCGLWYCEILIVFCGYR